MRLLVLFVLGLASISGCSCPEGVKQVKPSLGVSPPGLDFGQVKVADSKTLTVRVDSQTKTAVTFSSIKIEGAGAGAYRLGTTPSQVESLSSDMFTVTFTPTTVAAFTATLVLNSDDPDHPATRVALAGEGAEPKLELTPDCQASRGCMASVVVSPPSIDFGMEPLVRLMPTDPTRLPTLIIVNSGSVPLHVTGAAFGGTDAAAFSVAGNQPFPDGGVNLEAAEGFNLPLRFVPTSELQSSYSGEIVITSDDPDRPSITVPLTGTLKPNAPPVVCANLIRVVPQLIGDAPRDYSGTSFWTPLLTPPPGGYDFTATRDVRPDELAVFSANSDTDVTKCSTDPEDGRNGLTYRWRLTATPPGAQNLALAGATTAQVQLRPIITGQYTLELTVTDSRLSATTVTMRFAVAVKQDLVAQLEWQGFSGVDLDLHLVRPSAVTGSDAFTGAYTFFNAGASGKTAGDLNGFAKRTKDSNAVAGFDFDWGMPGASDDPTLNVDDRGDGQLVENASLNYPENDPNCATASCTYRVMVHYFADSRMHVAPPACVVDGGVGCLDGEPCSCANSGDRCVAESAPVGSAPIGSGKCYLAPSPVVRLFFKGSPTAANVIPLDTLMPADAVLLGAPCKLWHVADISWPALTAIGSLPDGGTPPPVVTVVGADGTGRVTTPSLARFGLRAAGGSLRCEPDTTANALPWYSRQP